MKHLYSLLISLCIILFITAAYGVEKKITIIHSNDLHSHLLGFAPNIDYTKGKTNDDSTRGGWSRIATVIKDIKGKRQNPVLILDAGDFLMGTFFHMISREEALELQILKDMGYDAIAIGNHEFDLRPDGLARILTSASRYPGMPAFLLANAEFSKDKEGDDSLEKVYKKGILKPYTIIERNGLKIGLYGVVGHDAVEVAPFASPVTFKGIVETSKDIVATLRNKEKVDMVICLSHSGLHDDKSRSEDEILAKEVPGIDIIISGHTHTKLTEPIIVNNTPIVQSSAYGLQLGVLDITFKDGKIRVDSYKAVQIDDSIPTDPSIDRRIESLIGKINQKVLRPYNLKFYQTIAETDFDLTIKQDECNLGSLIADSIRWYVNKYDSDPKDPSTRVNIGIESYGLIRDDVLKGKTGKIAACDIFRAFPLGIGVDDTMAYPIATFYINAQEVKKSLEVLTSIWPIKGSDYFLQISGAKFTYNPNRVIFDRVTEIWLEDENGEYQTLDYSSSNKKLYRVAANYFNSSFLKVIGGFTSDILEIIPKDKDGNPIESISDVIVDIDKNKAGTQEMKEWLGIIEYIRSFPDTDGNGIPNIPERYRNKEGRIVAQASWNPVSLLSRGTWITWTAFIVIFVVCPLLLFGLYKGSRFAIRKFRG